LDLLGFLDGLKAPRVVLDRDMEVNLKKNKYPSPAVQAQLRLDLALPPAWRLPPNMSVTVAKNRLKAVLAKTGHELLAKRVRMDGVRQLGSYIE
jgi:hypothetical protein